MAEILDDLGCVHTVFDGYAHSRPLSTHSKDVPDPHGVGRVGCYRENSDTQSVGYARRHASVYCFDVSDASTRAYSRSGSIEKIGAKVSDSEFHVYEERLFSVLYWQGLESLANGYHRFNEYMKNPSVESEYFDALRELCSGVVLVASSVESAVNYATSTDPAFPPEWPGSGWAAKLRYVIRTREGNEPPPGTMEKVGELFKSRNLIVHSNVGVHSIPIPAEFFHLRRGQRSDDPRVLATAAYAREKIVTHFRFKSVVRITEDLRQILCWKIGGDIGDVAHLAPAR